MNPEITNLRARLDLDHASFARLMGVDPRTVRRWVSGESEPTPSAWMIIHGLRESLDKDPTFAPQIVKFTADAVRVGGLSYLVVKLFDQIRERGD